MHEDSTDVNFVYLRYSRHLVQIRVYSHPCSDFVFNLATQNARIVLAVNTPLVKYLIFLGVQVFAVPRQSISMTLVMLVSVLWLHLQVKDNLK